MRLRARQPSLRSPALRDERWHIPDHFNFTRDVVEALAGDPKRRALTSLGKDGVIEPRSFMQISEGATRWASILREHGVRLGTGGGSRREASTGSRSSSASSSAPSRSRAHHPEGRCARGSDLRHRARTPGGRALGAAGDRADDLHGRRPLPRRRPRAPRIGRSRRGADAQHVVPRSRFHPLDSWHRGRIEGRRAHTCIRLRESGRRRALARCGAGRCRVVSGAVDSPHAVWNALAGRGRVEPRSFSITGSSTRTSDSTCSTGSARPSSASRRRSTERSPGCASSIGSARRASDASSRPATISSPRSSRLSRSGGA